jgi:hypothetical protein
MASISAASSCARERIAHPIPKARCWAPWVRCSAAALHRARLRSPREVWLWYAVSYVMICSPIAIICQPLPQPSAQSVPLVDAAAREMNIDPAELRRRNFIPRDAYPYRTPVAAWLFDPVPRCRGRSSLVKSQFSACEAVASLIVGSETLGAPVSARSANSLLL